MLSPQHGRKALHYSGLAAEQAEAQSAWAEAARHYENMLTLISDPSFEWDADEAALLVSLGSCALNAGDQRSAWRNLMRAIDLYRTQGDANGIARATMRVARINVAPASAYRLLAAATTATGLEPGLEAELRALLALNPATPDAERESARQRALDLAPVEDLPHVRALVALGDGHRAARRGQFEEATQRLGAALAPLRAQDALSLVGPAYVMQFLVLMSAGHVARGGVGSRGRGIRDDKRPTRVS